MATNINTHFVIHDLFAWILFREFKILWLLLHTMFFLFLLSFLVFLLILLLLLVGFLTLSFMALQPCIRFKAKQIYFWRNLDNVFKNWPYFEIFRSPLFTSIFFFIHHKTPLYFTHVWLCVDIVFALLVTTFKTVMDIGKKLFNTENFCSI